ncbi:MAG: hypothetical protein AAF721_17390 [Myxococcota bacterium]
MTPDANTERGRWCGICDAASMRHQRDKSIGAGMTEQTWVCTSCGGEAAFLGAGSRLILWALGIALTVAWLVGLAMGKVKPGDEVAISVGMAVLVGGVAALAIQSARVDRRHPAGEFTRPYRQTPAPQREILDEYTPPTLRDRLTHPFTIFGLLVVAGVAGLWGWHALEQHRAAALQRELEPIAEEWELLRTRGVEHAARIGPLLEAQTPRAEACREIAGVIDVVHRPLLDALAAGERFPRPDHPAWLNTLAYRYLAGLISPGMNPPAHHERLAVVSRAIEAPCVGVLDTTVATHSDAVGDSSFRGGEVAGELSIVCSGSEARRCSTRVASAPTFAIAVVQDNAAAQDWADQDAARRSASDAYRDALTEALARLAPQATLAPD